MNRRRSGILLHLTSLPSPFGIGDMGPWAYKFADFLAEAKQGLWQVLPLNPTDLACYNSPYHSCSAFACNPLLISPELLVGEGLLSRADLEPLPCLPDDRVDYQAASALKHGLFEKAYTRFKRGGDRPDYQQFCIKNAFWLDDFALFMALKSRSQGKTWHEWPRELRDRHPEALQSARKEDSDAVEKENFLQYLFFKQWASLKRYCNDKGIRLIGDIPIYVVYDSADLWVHPGLFNLDEEKRPLTVAGVPPDYFSKTGQLWGNPVYRWEVLKETGYEWWVQRMAHILNGFDLVRVDHFRGFVAYWEVPATEKNAINGRWVQAPAMEFFTHLSEKFPALPIIAEDLGTITPDVLEVMEHFRFPGMKVLLFAFASDSATNLYLPHNHVENCVVFTGTHDNDTARSWFEQEASREERSRLFAYLGREVAPEEIPWALIRLAMMSVAEKTILPMQDILGLGAGARMNRPARKEGNWQWRLLPRHLTPLLTRKLLEVTEVYGRGA